MPPETVALVSDARLFLPPAMVDWVPVAVLVVPPLTVEFVPEEVVLLPFLAELRLVPSGKMMLEPLEPTMLMSAPFFRLIWAVAERLMARVSTASRGRWRWVMYCMV